MNQLDILIQAFNRGESLTVLTAIENYGIYALSQRCGDLFTKRGYWVDSRTIETPSGKRVSEYFKGRIAHG